MVKKTLMIGVYLAVLTAGIVICRGRTIPLYTPHAPLHHASLLLPAAAHSVHSTPSPRKHTHQPLRRIA